MEKRLKFHHCKYPIEFIEKNNIALALTPRELYSKSVVGTKGWYFNEDSDVSKEVEDALYFETSSRYICNFIFKKNYDSSKYIKYVFKLIENALHNLDWNSIKLCFTFTHCGKCHDIVAVGSNANDLQCGSMGDEGFFCIWCELC